MNKFDKTYHSILRLNEHWQENSLEFIENFQLNLFESKFKHWIILKLYNLYNRIIYSQVNFVIYTRYIVTKTKNKNTLYHYAWWCNNILHWPKTIPDNRTWYVNRTLQIFVYFHNFQSYQYFNCVQPNIVFKIQHDTKL